MIAYITSSEGARFGVEPICRTLGWNPSTFYAAKKRPPSRRAIADEVLTRQIERVYDDNFKVYGARKIHRQMNREGISIGRCRVQRLMRQAGIHGVRRGKVKRTTFGDDRAARPFDLVERNFKAHRPDQLWVADLTYVRTWSGFVYVSFVIDVYSRMIVGWSLATHLRTDLPLDALEMAIWRRDRDLDGLIHHSDAGTQFTSIIYTERLADAGIEPSVGSRGDSYDNALAESEIGLFKTELIRQQGPWRTPEQVELATLEWVDWFNNRRLHSSIGHIPPAELEESYYAARKQQEQLTESL
jgi:putative transposase